MEWQTRLIGPSHQNRPVLAFLEVRVSIDKPPVSSSPQTCLIQNDQNGLSFDQEALSTHRNVEIYL